MRASPVACALVSLLWLASLGGCGTPETPSDDWWGDGVGGSRAVPTLSTLDVDGLNCDAQHVAGVTCQFVDDGVLVVVEREREPSDAISSVLSVFFNGTARNVGQTPGTGSVRSSSLPCYYGASTVGAPEGCELELQGIVRGQAGGGAAGSGGAVASVEVGSRVRVRVSCPAGLYYPGTVDVNPFWVPIVPSEFALEAQDCVVVDE